MTRNNNHLSTFVPRVPKELQPRREDPQIFETSTDLPTSPVCPTTNPGGFGLRNKRMQTKFRDPFQPSPTSYPMGRFITWSVIRRVLDPSAAVLVKGACVGSVQRILVQRLDKLVQRVRYLKLYAVRRGCQRSCPLAVTSALRTH